MKKSKKSWFRGLTVAGVFAISVLNLSISFQKDKLGKFNLSKFSISSTNAMALYFFEDSGDSTTAGYSKETIECSVGRTAGTIVLCRPAKSGSCEPHNCK